MPMHITCLVYMPFSGFTDQCEWGSFLTMFLSVRKTFPFLVHSCHANTPWYTSAFYRSSSPRLSQISALAIIKSSRLTATADWSAAVCLCEQAFNLETDLCCWFIMLFSLVSNLKVWQISLSSNKIHKKCESYTVVSNIIFGVALRALWVWELLSVCAVFLENRTR